MATIKDIASYCNVAVSTVSRVLNDHPDVSPDTRTKVLEAARNLRYVPNNSARDLSRTKTDAIGLIVRGAGNPFFTPIIRSIEKCILDAGYTMEILQIAAGDNQINAFHPVRTKMIPQSGTFHIRNQQNFQDQIPPGI